MKLPMPREEWETFYNFTIRRHNLDPAAIANLQMCFWGGLVAAAEFFSELMAGEGSPEEKQKLYETWMTEMQSIATGSGWLVPIGGNN